MNSDDEYFIPKNIEDNFLPVAAVMVKEVLSEIEILENILQNYVRAYNMTLKENCSARSLQVMNQNYKPIFSTITLSEIIRTSIAEDEDTGLDGKTSNESRLTSTSPNKNKTAISNIFDEMKFGHFESSAGSYMEIAKINESPDLYLQERFNLGGKPETITSSSIYSQDTSYSEAETIEKHQIMVTSSKNKNETLINCATNDKSSIENSVVKSSLLSFEGESKHSDKPLIKKQESFFPDEDLKIAPNLFVDYRDKSDETSVKFQKLNTGIDKEEKTPANPTMIKRVTVNGLSNYQKIKTHSPNMNERESINYSENTPISTCSRDKDQELVVPPKTSKTDSELIKEDKKIVISADVSATDGHDFFIPTKKDPENENKSVNLSTESAMDDSNSVGDYVMDDGKAFNPAGDCGMDDGKAFNPAGDCVMDDGKAFNPAGDCVMDDGKAFNPAGDCDMDDGKAFNPAGDCVMDDIKPDNSTVDACDSLNGADDYKMGAQIIVHDDDKSLENNISTILTNNNSKSEILSIEPSGRSETAAYETSTTQKCAPYFSRINGQNKTTVVISDVSNSKEDQNNINCPIPNETKYFESQTDFVQILNPSVKRSLDDTSQNTLVNKSKSGDATFTRPIFPRDSQRKTEKQTIKDLVYNILSPKEDIAYGIQVVKFFEMLQERRDRLHLYIPLFIKYRQDFTFIYNYIQKIISVMDNIRSNDFNEELRERVNNLEKKASKLLRKVVLWKSDIERDLLEWTDCFQKTKRLIKVIMGFKSEKVKNVALKKFLKWEIHLKIINKKVDDMILLREVRRPMILQFGNELENFIKLFIQCLLLVGLLKRSSKVSSD